MARASSLVLLVGALLCGCANTPYLTEPGQAYRAFNGLVELESTEPFAARAEYERLLILYGPPKQPHGHYADLLQRELGEVTKQPSTPHLSADAVLGVVRAYDTRCEVAATLHRRVAHTHITQGKWAAAEASAQASLDIGEGILSAYSEAESCRRTWKLLASIRTGAGRMQAAMLAGLRARLLEGFQRSPEGRRALTLQREVAQRGASRIANLRQFLWQVDRRKKNVPSWEQKIEPLQVLARSNAEREVLRSKESRALGGLLAAQLAEPDMGADPLGAIQTYLEKRDRPQPALTQALATLREALEAGEEPAAAAADLAKALQGVEEQAPGPD